MKFFILKVFFKITQPDFGPPLIPYIEKTLKTILEGPLSYLNYLI